MTATATHLPSRRIAVFGSVAAERPPAEEVERPLSPPSGAVLERVIEAIASNAPAIARPIVDRAVVEGSITRSDRHAILLELGNPDGSGADGTSVSLGARRTLREALAAVRRAAPAIARPILDEAVGDERLTPAQERRILERLRSSPARVLRGARRGRTPRPAASA